MTALRVITKIVDSDDYPTALDSRAGSVLPYLGAGLTNWSAQLAKNQGGSALNPTIAIIGDSWVSGPGLVTHMRDLLQALYGNGGPGWIAIGGDRGHDDSSVVSYSRTGAWADRDHGDTPRGVDLTDAETSDLLATVTITTNFTDAEIHYIEQVSGGIFRYRIDGGSWTSVDTSAVAEAHNSVSLPTQSDENHTLEIDIQFAPVILSGVNCWVGNSGVIVHNLGNGGTTAGNWAGVDAALWQSSLTALGADTVMILLGTNDHSQHVAPTSYGASIEALVGRIGIALPLADIVFLSAADNGLTGKTYQTSDYRDEMLATAQSLSLHFIDTHTAIGDYETSNTRGLYANSSHLSAAGDRVFANYVVRWLREAEKTSSLQEHDHSSASFGGTDIQPDVVRYSHPFNNLFDGSGRLGTVAWNIRNDTAFSAPTSVYEYNGATAWIEAGKFIYDNTDNGGSRGSMTQTTIDLLAAMGRTGTAARYGVEFYIGQSTAGSGTAGAYSGQYAMFRNGGGAITGIGNYVTYALWLRVVSGDDIIVRESATSFGPIELYENGIRTAGDIVLTPADGWTHIIIVQKLSIGYNTTSPAIHALSGTVVQFALWCHFLGKVVLPPHASPIPNTQD